MAAAASAAAAASSPAVRSFLFTYTAGMTSATLAAMDTSKVASMVYGRYDRAVAEEVSASGRLSVGTFARFNMTMLFDVFGRASRGGGPGSVVLREVRNQALSPDSTVDDFENGVETMARLAYKSSVTPKELSDPGRYGVMDVARRFMELEIERKTSVTDRGELLPRTWFGTFAHAAVCQGWRPRTEEERSFFLTALKASVTDYDRAADSLRALYVLAASGQAADVRRVCGDAVTAKADDEGTRPEDYVEALFCRQAMEHGRPSYLGSSQSLSALVDACSWVGPWAALLGSTSRILAHRARGKELLKAGRIREDQWRALPRTGVVMGQAARSASAAAIVCATAELFYSWSTYRQTAISTGQSGVEPSVLQRTADKLFLGFAAGATAAVCFGTRGSAHFVVPFLYYYKHSVVRSSPPDASWLQRSAAAAATTTTATTKK